MGDTTPGRKHASTSATSVIRLLRSENKEKKKKNINQTHRNSVSGLREPQNRGEKPPKVGLYPLLLFHVFVFFPQYNPRPLSPHPRNREREAEGETWVIARGGKHDPGHAASTLRGQFISQIQPSSATRGGRFRQFPQTRPYPPWCTF